MTSHAEHNSRSPRHFSHRITIVIVAQAQHREHGEFDLAGDLARSSPMEIRSALGLTVRVASRFLVASVTSPVTFGGNGFGCQGTKWMSLLAI